MNSPNLSPPNGLNRSGIACWWSILNLITDATAAGIPCFMWTLTFAKTYPDSWCGNMHATLVRYLANDSKNGLCGVHGFGGVRVTEVHPGGHGIHFHWIIRGKLPLHLVRRRAKQCGFGHVFIARDSCNRFRRIDTGAAGYVCKYLTKGDTLAGVRKWACIGNYDGTKTRDIEFDSQSNRVFRAAYRTAQQSGAPASICFQTGKLAQRNYQHNADDRDTPGGVGCLEPGLEEIGTDSPIEEQSRFPSILGGTHDAPLEPRKSKAQKDAEFIQRLIETALPDDRDTI